MVLCINCLRQKKNYFRAHHLYCIYRENWLCIKAKEQHCSLHLTLHVLISLLKVSVWMSRIRKSDVCVVVIISVSYWQCNSSTEGCRCHSENPPFHSRENKGRMRSCGLRPGFIHSCVHYQVIRSRHLRVNRCDVCCE